MQDPGSKYLTPAGLKFHRGMNPDKYNQVIVEFGPYDTTLEEAANFERIAHRIRNYASNQWRTMRNFERRYQGSYSLFGNDNLYGDRALLALLLSNKKTGTTCHSNPE